jgi:4-amino-4-deoxychorismate lyase
MNKKFFETIKCDDYEIYNLDYHIKRISNTIGLNINLQEYIYPPNAQLLKCKVIYDKDNILDISYNIYNKKEIKNFKLIYSNLSYNTKMLNRDAIDLLISQKQNNDEIIIIKNNLITDTSIANIAIYYNEEWITPKTPLLKGTTLQRYINNGTIKQKDISIQMLKKASKIALLNAMIDFDIINNYTIKD